MFFDTSLEADYTRRAVVVSVLKINIYVPRQQEGEGTILCGLLLSRDSSADVVSAIVNHRKQSFGIEGFQLCQ